MLFSHSRKKSNATGCGEIVPYEPRRDGNDIAVVACRNGWCPAERLQQVVGVSRVVQGYTGGLGTNPTRDDPQDHVQGLFIEYSRMISYTELLLAVVQVQLLEQQQQHEEEESPSSSAIPQSNIQDENSTPTELPQSSSSSSQPQHQSAAAIFPRTASQHRQAIDFLYTMHKKLEGMRHENHDHHNHPGFLTMDVSAATAFYRVTTTNDDEKTEEEQQQQQHGRGGQRHNRDGCGVGLEAGSKNRSFWYKISPRFSRQALRPLSLPPSAPSIGGSIARSA